MVALTRNINRTQPHPVRSPTLYPVSPKPQTSSLGLFWFTKYNARLELVISSSVCYAMLFTRRSDFIILIRVIICLCFSCYDDFCPYQRTISEASRLSNLGLCRPLTPFEQGQIFIVTHTAVTHSLGFHGLIRGTNSFSLLITQQAKDTEDFMVSSEEPTHLVSLSHNKRRGPRTLWSRPRNRLI